MPMAPQVVFGVPSYNGECHIASALESLLAQTRDDLAIVVVDDGSTDRTVAVAEAYARQDARVTVHRNPARLGMVRNWRRVYELARELHPQAELFAWASDHDLWHPRWLEVLADELEAHPETVLAWPLYDSMDQQDRSLNHPPKRFDSTDEASGAKRLLAAIDGMSAGNMVYGLMRADAPARCGIYHEVVLPDRLLMAQLSLLGEVRQVPEVLWRRRFGEARASLERQRESFFPGRRAPLYMHLPWWLMHAGPFLWSTLRGALSPEIGRREAVLLARDYVVRSYQFERRRERNRRRKRREKRHRRRRLAVKRAFKRARKMGKRARRLPLSAAVRWRDRIRGRHGGTADNPAPVRGGEPGPPPPRPAPLNNQEEIAEAFHRLYYGAAERTWKDTSWLGVRTEKVPFDLWVYQELLFEQRPDAIVETGTAMGGSALFMANVCELIGKGVVITVDVRPDEGRPQHSRIRYVQGSSTDPAVLEDVRALLPRTGEVLVVLDSDHSRDHVLAELRAYQEFVPLGGYMIVEDSNVHGHPVLPEHGPGPMEAIDAFLAETDRFEIDPAREKFFLTFSPRGYLKRVR